MRNQDPNHVLGHEDLPAIAGDGEDEPGLAHPQAAKVH